MRTVEKLGPLSKLLIEIGVDPRLPIQLLVARLYTVAPKLVSRLADAS
ncbi:hypothetical protein [Pyrobaculum neutrophilum]|uniref:Uncharacterized protein n=1 Tax=Pyrobaculum neutrophilum (strain DSM 2338 / JCM 9278 / NBRC 100436 / V24Sta) TaxID=444157 RepID=B1YCQ2_PYRNV|nr:hypothetical protein [Pyrobaculum neutrophilum]ACB39565.1 conserved hypothetical protein [Pyrobaculum neutrophilum V24Sta]